MASDVLLAPLRRVALFQGLSPLQITEIARRAERIVFRKGETIVRTDENGDAAYLIASDGAVRIEGPDVADASEAVPPGALVGEMAMLIETEHTSTVVATGNVRALRIPRSTMLELMAEDSSLADHFVAKIAGRLMRLRDELHRIDRELGATEADFTELLPPPGAHHGAESGKGVKGLDTRH